MTEVVVVRLERRDLELHHLLLSLHCVYLLLQLLLDTSDFRLMTVDLAVAFSEELVVAFEPD